MMKSTVMQAIRMFCTSMLCVTVMACGGGGGSAAGNTGSSSTGGTASGSDGVDTGTSTSLLLSGYAATGHAAASGTVSASCASGATASTLLGAGGRFSIAIPHASRPCVLRFVGQDVEGNDVTFFSIAEGQGPGTASVQLTPLSTAIVSAVASRLGYVSSETTAAQLMYGNAIALFLGMPQAAVKLPVSFSLEQNGVRQALQTLATGRGLDISGLDFLAGPLLPAGTSRPVGDIYDQLLDGMRGTGLSTASVATAVITRTDTAKAAIFGAWVDPVGILYVFSREGMFWTLDSAPAATPPTQGSPGIERGYFFWTENKLHVPMPEYSRNGARGLSPRTLMVPDPSTTGHPSTTIDTHEVSIAGNTLTLDGARLGKVEGSTGILGAWAAHHAGSIDGTVILVFLTDGTFYQAQFGQGPCAPNGLPNDYLGYGGSNMIGFERGTYNWDATTGALTTVVMDDMNGTWGFSHLPPGSTPRLLRGDNGKQLHFTASSLFTASPTPAPTAAAQNIVCQTPVPAQGGEYELRFTRIE